MAALSKPPSAERRSEKRQIANCLVKLDPGMGRPPFTCFVWDMSESGIRLKLAEKIELPPTVHIVIGNARKAAKVVWQKADQAGFKFFEMSATTK